MTRLIFLAGLMACAKEVPVDSSVPTGGGTTTTDPCVATSVPPPQGDPLTIPLAGECAMADDWGGFLAATYEIFSVFTGEIADGVVPITVREDVTDAAYTGTECRMLRRNTPSCPQGCNPDETCDFDGNCIPFPLNQDLGTVTVGGLAVDLILEPVAPGNNYFDVNLPHPAFQPGDLIEVRTGCGAFEPITLHGVGVETLVLTDPDWDVVEGQDLQFSWNAPTVPVNPGQHVHVRLNIDQHGNTPVELDCEFPDTGSAALPSILIDQLRNFGVTGFPNATVTRRTVDSTSVGGGGCADFTVASPSDPSIRVDGYIPCVPGLSTCPTGMTCNPDTGNCE